MRVTFHEQATLRFAQTITRRSGSFIHDCFELAQQRKRRVTETHPRTWLDKGSKWNLGAFISQDTSSQIEDDLPASRVFDKKIMGRGRNLPYQSSNATHPANQADALLPYGVVIHRMLLNHRVSW